LVRAVEATSEHRPKRLNTFLKMAKAARKQELKQAFEKHYGETEEHIERLEQVIKQNPARPARRSWASRMPDRLAPWSRHLSRLPPLSAEEGNHNWWTPDDLEQISDIPIVVRGA
jgi:hypothetical protein